MARNTIGFFLHTPFPAAEVLRLLPNHRDLVAALCAYDLVGFQTVYRPARLPRLSAALGRRRGTWAAARSAPSAGSCAPRCFRSASMSRRSPAQAAAAEKSRHMRRLRDSIRDRALLIGVDRLDYSKGLPARFAAYSHLLEHYPRDPRPHGAHADRAAVALGRSGIPRDPPRRSRPPPATSTAATPNSTGRRCAISTRASTIAS